MKYIFFTYDLISASIAHKLMNEGRTVVVAQVHDVKDLGNDDKPEDAESKKSRLSNYNGIFEKYDAKKVLKKMKNIKNKDEWFVFVDFNNLWRFSELVLKMGFTKGFFPTRQDFELEKDRAKAKELVEENYPDLSLVQTYEFQKIQEAIDFLDEQEETCFVLKGNSDLAKTHVPSSTNSFLANSELIDVMTEFQKDYEKDGFILEERIQDPMELTPEVIFWNGEPIAYSVDIETKPIGSGNIGDQTGCASCLVLRTEPEDKINQVAFPQFVMDFAKNRKGMFVWDASCLYRDGIAYFGEFCSCRVGWDSIFNEIMMAGSASQFFERIASGKNPFVYRYGASVRGFSLPEKDKGESFKVCESSMRWMECVDKNIFPYEMKKDGENVTNLGSSTDLVVFAAASDDKHDAIEEVYDAIENFAFDDLYYKPRFDFCSFEYPSSIMNRYEYGLMDGLYSCESEGEIQEVETAESMQELQ